MGSAPQQRHHDNLHQELESDAESNTDEQGEGPALGPHEPNLTPGRARPPSPQQHKNGAERHNDQVAREDNENRKDSKRSKSAQANRDTISRLQAGLRRGRDLQPGCNEE